jgi:hypothetical protein
VQQNARRNTYLDGLLGNARAYQLSNARFWRKEVVHQNGEVV